MGRESKEPACTFVMLSLMFSSLRTVRPLSNKTWGTGKVFTPFLFDLCLQILDTFLAWEQCLNCGRNFGLKSGGTNLEVEWSILGSRDERRGEWGWTEEVPLHSWLIGLRERQELSQLCPERIPGRKRFYCNLNSADRLCWQQMTANSSPFRPEKKVGVLYPSVQKVGYRYPSYLS